MRKRMVDQQRRQLLKYGSSVAASMLCAPLFAESRQYDVIVVGAGLAGLHCADLLQQQGASVAVLEGNNRVGGRLHTLDHLPERPETGAIQIGESYSEMQRAIARLKLTLQNPPAPVRGLTLSVAGETLDAQHWPNFSANPFAENHKSILPSRLVFSILKQELANINSAGWNTKKNAALDISLKEYLQKRGLSAKTLALIDNNFNANGIDAISTADVLRKIHLLSRGSRAWQTVAGGNSRLPEAMAASLAHSPMLGKMVNKLKANGRNIDVHCEDGSHFRAAHCVVAVPFSTLRDITLAIELTKSQQDAIRALGYTAVTQIHMQPKSAFWQDDGLSPNMWTDTPLGRVFAVGNDAGQVTRLVSWVNGRAAEKMDRLNDKDIAKATLNTFAKIRPSSKNQLDVMHICSWTKNRFARGAFAHFRPGQVQGFSRTMMKPAGAVYFVGEHTEYEHSGMEAAMVSARRAVDDIMQRQAA